MAPIYRDNAKRLWRVRDSLFSPWRDLPGTHTGAEIWELLNTGRFAAAIPADDTPPKESAPDD